MDPNRDFDPTTDGQDVDGVEDTDQTGQDVDQDGTADGAEQPRR